MRQNYRRIRHHLMAAAALAGGSALLAACSAPVTAPSQFDVALESCIASEGAPGTYTASRSDLGPNGLPVIRAAAGGTVRGEVLLNACVDARARPQATGRSTARVVVTNRPVVVERVRGTNVGGLALPTQYPLLPGDAALWASLTRAQQDRALQFLRNGSTIRSSLGGDL